MFQAPTLFIVGAGASCDFGFKPGDGLIKDIARLLNPIQDRNRVLSDPLLNEAIAVHAVQGRNSSDYDERQRLMQAAAHISRAAPLEQSIDQFLDSRRDDMHIKIVGKLGITRMILQWERNSDLYFDHHRERYINFTKSDKSWLKQFWLMAREGISRDEVSTIFENACFVVFNYDRCIEHYLHNALQQYYGMKYDEATQIVASLKIVHPYGQAGMLDWQPSPLGQVRFGEESSAESLLLLSKQIKTFTEQVEDHSVIEKINEFMSVAQTLIFLGFGFNQQNLMLLGVNDGPCYRLQRTLATAYGFSDEDRLGIRRRIDKFSASKGTDPDVHVLPLTCYEFFDRFKFCLRLEPEQW